MKIERTMGEMERHDRAHGVRNSMRRDYAHRVRETTRTGQRTGKYYEGKLRVGTGCDRNGNGKRKRRKCMPT